jgi:hypothetical protein
MRKNQIIINSTILFVVASTLAMTLHEFGHFIASILVHAQNISIHHNHTSNSDLGLSINSTMIIKSAGPLVSLMIGLLFHFICSRQTKRNILFLFNLYMSSFGYIAFFGYLMISPFFANSGDTGYICYALGIPTWLRITIALAAGVTLYFLMNILVRYFVEMASKEIVENNETRKQFVNSLLLYPIFIGIILTSLLNLPIKVILSLIAPVCSPFSFFWGYRNALTKIYPFDNFNREFESLNKPHFWLFLSLIVIVIMNRLLVYGIYYN